MKKLCSYHEFNKAETLMSAILTQTQKWSEQEKKAQEGFHTKTEWVDKISGGDWQRQENFMGLHKRL